MSLIEIYLPVKMAHVGLALTSGALFALRGAAVLAGMRWPLRAALRHGSAAIDTCLLLAGVLLVLMWRTSPAQQPWFAWKLGVLVLYIVLGTLALRRARAWRTKAICYAGALLCFGFMVAVARTRDPLGWLGWLPL